MDTNGLADYFAKLQENPMFNMGMALMSQWKTPYGVQGSLSGAMKEYQDMQMNKRRNKLLEMEMTREERRAKQEAEQAAAQTNIMNQIPNFYRPELKGSLEQGKVGPGIDMASEQAKMLMGQELDPGVAEMVSESGVVPERMQGTLADTLKNINSSANYVQQGTPNEMPLVGQPGGFDKTGFQQATMTDRFKLDPKGTLSDLIGGAAEANYMKPEVGDDGYWWVIDQKTGNPKNTGVKAQVDPDKRVPKHIANGWFMNPDGTLTKNDALAADILAGKKAGATQVSVGGPQVAIKEFDKSWGDYSIKLREKADTAAKVADDVNYVTSALQGYGGGPIKDFQGFVGKFAPDSEWGKLANVKELADTIQAKLAPTMREVGSGATSDFEMKMWMKAVPTLATTEKGRVLMQKYTNRVAERAAARAEIEMQLMQEGNRNPSEINKRMKARFGDSFIDPQDKKDIINMTSAIKQAPKGVDQELWDVMTPGERALWKK